MASIAVLELRPSFLAEMESAEITTVIGGSIIDSLFGAAPAFELLVGFTPLGGPSSIGPALGAAIGYGGYGGIVIPGLLGGVGSFFGLPVKYPTAY
ncbi:hypothetical protein [Crocosphaera sp. XPORK-15E]|uniref:hypothetical protein n=1 Tax=Crocosphaera sp. XPORK-15E TaxID=3110247 RepID=UPI002B1FA51E|nr:hypothetical protein [Crocosphaera sp. XPORK-15E]MEA5536365.1 hypothetical protein [Crocosphaera sp. XPORK-15E]